MEKVTVDKQFSLRANDFLKGMYVSVIAPIILLILEQFQIGNFSLDWKGLGTLAVTTFFGYLLKNYFSYSRISVIEPNSTTESLIKKAVK